MDSPETSKLRVLMVEDEEDTASLLKFILESGANDDMIKPFNPRELTNRLKRFVAHAA